MDYNKIIDKYYPEETERKRILITHSKSVAQRALQIADLHPELSLDREFLEEAAMLHDLGIFACDAKAIDCHGTEPYIRHGIIGADILRKEGFPQHARVCERHTGTGLPAHHIEMLQLPLPPYVDYCPETLEEKIICYADKFYSKTHLNQCKTMEQAYRSLMKFGHDTAERFKQWHQEFEG